MICETCQFLDAFLRFCFGDNKPDTGGEGVCNDKIRP
jgi:hypothetical protein